MPRRRKHPYLTLRDGIWYVRKKIKVGEKARTIKRSTGYSRDQEALAEAVGSQIIREETEKLLYGYSDRTWGEAAAKLLELEGYQKRHVYHCELLRPYLEVVRLIEMHTNHPQLVRFKTDRQNRGCTNNTVNRSLEVVSRVLNFATELRDGAEPWMKIAPRIRKLRRDDAPNYPLSQGEYRALFKILEARPHLYDMAMYALHTGCREAEITRLRWQWERKIPELETSVFHLPTSKNGLPRLIVLNSKAKDIVDRQRGKNPEYVFTYECKPVGKMNNSAWKTARRQVGLENVRGNGKHFRVHDLRVTCSTWLREAGVSKEDRCTILGHYNGDITTHYSVAEVGYLLKQVERLVDFVHKPSFYLVRAAG